MKIGYIIFGLPITLGLVALSLNTYVKSGGQYLVEYSTLGKIWTLLRLIGALAVVYSLFWMISPFVADFDKANIQMKLDIWKDHTKAEHDKEGNVIAYRYFFIKDNGVPISVGDGANGYNPITDRSRGSYAGGYNISDKVPTLKNRNGIYAAKTKNSPILDQYNTGGHVLAQVRLSGRIIEADYGYRAQYCEIIKLYE